MITKPSNKVAIVGRIQTWLDSPYSKENKQFPVSCTVKKLKAPEYTGDISGYFDTIRYVTKALLGAAGVNVILDEFPGVYDKGLKFTAYDWGWYVSPEYPGSSIDKADANYVDLANPEPDTDYTVIKVADSMEDDGSGNYSIIDSWKEALELFTEDYGHFVVFDLSDLRPDGTANGRGLIASGAFSFVSVYRAIAEFVKNPRITVFMQLLSTINGVVRRGGVFKNGAVTTSLSYYHRAIDQYLELPLADCPWLKKAITIDELLPLPLATKLVDYVNDGSLWLEKFRYDEDGNRIYSNVCREVFLQDEDTCLLLHGNCGSLEHPRQIVDMLVETMTTVCELHSKTGIDSSGIYKPSAESDQVGVGLLALANFLGSQQVRYKHLIVELEAAMDDYDSGKFKEWLREDGLPAASEIAKYFVLGYSAASDVAINYGMKRAFVIAPTASAAYRYQDTQGYTCCPEISPPTYRYTKRNSDTNGSSFYDHGPVEEAEDLGAEWHYRLFAVWQRLMNIKGLAHSSSFELWEPIDLPWVANWLQGPLWTTYYRRNIKREHLDKSKAALGGLKPRKPKVAISETERNQEIVSEMLQNLGLVKHYFDHGAEGVFDVSGSVDSDAREILDLLTNSEKPDTLDTQAKTKVYFEPVSGFTAAEVESVNTAAKNQILGNAEATKVDKVTEDYLTKFRNSVDYQSMLLGGSELPDPDGPEQLPEKFCLISDPDCTACAE